MTARLIVRRVKDARFPDALFPVWRCHPFFANTDDPVDAADITHRRHAIIETVFSDLIDGSVDPRATALVAPASTPAACSRLWAIAAHRIHAEFAPKRPDGMCARGPRIRVESVSAWPPAAAPVSVK